MPPAAISQVGQKIPQIKLQDFLNEPINGYKLEPLTKIDRSGHPTIKSVKNHIVQSKDRIRHPRRSKLMQKPLSPFLTD